MIIYNVTVKVQPGIADDWLHWLKEEHIPAMKGTGCFTHAVVLQILEPEDAEGITYAVQYHAESKALYNRYIERYADTMRQKGIIKWGDQFIAFRTVMQVVN
ncbi:MAG TPA: DUF4286 family protein [Chitinophagaceae bacterium]|nr:DUF4286 family protein [Chitinophagaceae bacterium]